MITEKQFRDMQRYRKLFLETGKIHKNVRPLVAESWKRSLEYGIEANPDIKKGTQTQQLSDGEIKKLLDDNKKLLDIANHTMIRVVDYIDGTQYAITLHDKEGRILSHIFAGDNPSFYSSSIGFNIGVKWDEKTIGTNAPFLCTTLDRDIQLVGHEHFSGQLCELACTAAPIHSEDGEVIACLNVIGNYTKLTSHTLVFVKAVALLIQTYLRHTEVISWNKDIFNLMLDGIVVLDNKYKVQHVSFKAESLLQLPRQSIYTLDFRKLFKKEDFEDRLQRETVTFNYPEYELTIGNKTIVCNVSISPMLTYEKLKGIIITFKEISQINKKVNQILGNRSGYSFDDIITQDAGVLALIEMMKNIANTDHCVLIEGESGTGKELFAHALHNESNRSEGPFIAVNCASLPRGLVESELFGYEKGAFTGARSEGSPGKFELADGGTIFLDEVGELPIEIQATLLRVLDNHRVVRIGGKTEKNLDVRVIAATNRDLYREVQNGNFRNDLYFRINVLKYDLPPLRARGDDVILLSKMFLEQMNDSQAQGKKVFSEDLLSAFKLYTWPGNVRELHNVVVRGFFASFNNTITTNELPQHIQYEILKLQSGNNLSYKQEMHTNNLKEFERQQIIDALRECNGNVVKAGAKLGFSKSTIYRRIREYDIELK